MMLCLDFSAAQIWVGIFIGITVSVLATCGYKIWRG
jgi:hypothetical protein